MTHSRIVYPDHPHHVFARGNNKRSLFSSVSDYQMFLFYALRAKKEVPLGDHPKPATQDHLKTGHF